MVKEWPRAVNGSQGWPRESQEWSGTVKSAGDSQWWSGMVLNGDGMTKSCQEVTKSGWGQSAVVQDGLGWLEVANSAQGMAENAWGMAKSGWEQPVVIQDGLGW